MPVDPVLELELLALELVLEVLVLAVVLEVPVDPVVDPCVPWVPVVLVFEVVLALFVLLELFVPLVLLDVFEAVVEVVVELDEGCPSQTQAPKVPLALQTCAPLRPSVQVQATLAPWMQVLAPVVEPLIDPLDEVQATNANMQTKPSEPIRTRILWRIFQLYMPPPASLPADSKEGVGTGRLFRSPIGREPLRCALLSSQEQPCLDSI